MAIDITLDQFKKIGTKADIQYISLWENTSHFLTHPTTSDIDRLTEAELCKTAYRVNTKDDKPLYVDNSLPGVTEDNYKQFIKFAYMSSYYEEMNYNYVDYRKYIWRWDKVGKYIENSTNTFVRCDYLKISIGAQNKFHRSKNQVTIRHNGSKEGINNRYTYNLQIAIPYLARLQQGPAFTNKLLDIYDGTPIKNYSLIQTKESIYFDMHHILVINGLSFDKTVEPSMLFSKIAFNDMLHNDIIEIMKCILLVTGLHKEIHSVFGSNSGYQEWKQLLADGKINMLPYYLLSEENYNETINWLSVDCKNFDISQCISYTDFINSISC